MLATRSLAEQPYMFERPWATQSESRSTQLARARARRRHAHVGARDALARGDPGRGARRPGALDALGRLRGIQIAAGGGLEKGRLARSGKTS